MKSTVVPAQITSVEDRIAGNLTFAQVLLLIIPLLLGTLIYTSFGPKLELTTLKSLLIGLQFLFFGGLAIRISGKILAAWLVVYLRYYFRPRLYIFTKNDLTGRTFEPPVAETPEPTETPTNKAKGSYRELSFDETVKLDQLLSNPGLSVSFEFAKKGGVDVSLRPVKD